MMRTWSGSTPLAAVIDWRAPCACCVDSHWCSRPSTHAAADPRTSSGQGATRWLTSRWVTRTSQPSKNESSVMPGMPSAVESNTTLLPAFGYRSVLLATEVSTSSRTSSGS